VQKNKWEATGKGRIHGKCEAEVSCQEMAMKLSNDRTTTNRYGCLAKSRGKDAGTVFAPTGIEAVTKTTERN
jgi:hypothetical protein